MLFSLDPKSPKSIYRQIVDRVKSDVARGALDAGDQLPTIREAAAQLRVNRNTVARAYRELEQQGIIYTRPGGGSFVADAVSDLQKRERVRILEEMAAEMVVQAFHFQIAPDELIEIITKQIETMERSRK
ncbi:MAG TPA: GntR family transcriptional regulator [bacterium]|nr:GntR family transcriptional regulator [bacterium]